jgi:hypothetical protein
MTGRGQPVLAVLTVTLAIVDGVMAWLGSLAWTGYRGGHMSIEEVATFGLLAVMATAGSVLLMVTAVAFALGFRGYGFARWATHMSWARLITTVVCLTIMMTVVLGPESIAGVTQTVGAILVVADAATGLYIARIAEKSTGHG